MSSHRSHAHYLAKGGSLKKMIAELYGKKDGCSKGIGGSMHLIDTKVNFMGTSSIVGNSIPISVGLGLSLNLKKQNNISYSFFGDGAMEEGVFYESLNFAALKNLPVMFICENNLYSVYTPMSQRRPKNFNTKRIVEGMGVKYKASNGNDILKVLSCLKNSIDYVKNKNKPIFIEFSTYRWLEHCGPNYDDHLNYRSKKTSHIWIKKKDPVKNLENVILKKIKNKKIIKKCEKKIFSEIKKAFEFAEKSKFLNNKKIKDLIYARK